MRRTPFNEMAWFAFNWQRPFELEAVIDMLTHLASHTPQIPIVFEARGYHGRIRYYIGLDRQFTRVIGGVMRAHGDIRFTEVPPFERARVNEAATLKITKPSLSLKTDIAEAVTRAGIAALLQPKGDEQAVIQVVLGLPFAPSPTPQNIPDPHASWLKIALGNVSNATAETKTVVREKNSSIGFNAVIRLGATGTRQTAQGHILSMLSALRTLRSAGVTVLSAKEDVDKLNYANIPWSFPLRLSVKELANFLLLPAGDMDLPGVAGLHPKIIMPPRWYQNPFPIHDRTFAYSLDKKTKLSISPRDSLEHCIILGPTGSGKSTAMMRMILSDIYAGRSVLVIDPKYELVNGLLARIPKHRQDDVVIIDPSAGSPVGFNPLAFKSAQNPNLIADAVLAVFSEVFKENWGIRSVNVLGATLLTLVKAKGSSLLWLPTILTNEAFRQKVTAGINDKIGLEAFWSAFESMSEREQHQEIAPAMSKMQQFLLRPGLRNVLGQANPKFDLNDLFTKPRIVLVPLNKGAIGEMSARLLGSLLVGLTWTLALGRATVPEEQRRIVSVFIDELQDYLSLPTSLSSALAQARGLGMALTLAHQYRSQLPKEICSGVDANARNKIIFGLNGEDARAMAGMAPELAQEDFMALPRYQIYTNFHSSGRNTGWVSGRTLPLPAAVGDAAELRRKVAERYGMPGAEVEREYLKLLESCRPTSGANGANDTDSAIGEADDAPVGRRKK